MKYPKLILISFLLLLVTAIFAQKKEARYLGKTTFPFGVVERIHSDELNEERILNIYLPQGYDPDSLSTYPVIYVLDGSENEDFPHIAGLAQFMNMYELLPKSIVVGIANVDRYRDFTYPSHSKSDIKAIPTSGGSPQFIQFMKKEVLPFIRKNYKTNGHQTIIGQSLGGLLTTEILFKYPNMFDDYIIVSPSLWWDKQKMVKKADKYLSGNLKTPKRVFVSLGKEHPTMHKVANKLVEALNEVEQKGMKIYYEPILTENHATILHKAVYLAFEKFYTTEKVEQK